MGIFSIIKEKCPKCGKLTIWDDPYSECGCYHPPDTTPEEAIKYTSDKELLISAKNNKEIVDKLKKKLKII